MNLYINENGDQIRGDQIAQTIFRSDLAPVPRTLEVVFKHLEGQEKTIREGKFLWGGYEGLKYRIIKVFRVKTGEIQGSNQLGAVKVIALLDSCAEVAFSRSRAVVRENSSLGGIYRACGAVAGIANDFPVSRFTCLVGEVPSFALAQAMQEEGAAMTLSGRNLSIVRLTDMMKKKPIRYLPYSDPTDTVESEFQTRHEIPAFISTDATGAVVKGNFDVPRAVAFVPRTDVRQLYNMTRVMVTRRVLRSQLFQEAQAGDVLSIGDVPYGIITAAHVIEMVDATYSGYSKFWLGELSI